MSLNDTKYKRVYDTKWNFKEGSMKELVHGLHPYPAMMMPLIARTMLNEYGKGAETIFLDPYVGSGTTLVEAQYYGVKKAIGVDLNPLAILISKVKTQKNSLKKVKELINTYDEFISNVVDAKAPEFSIRDSWFSEKVIEDLSKIREFIESINDDTTKDFFNLAFSEVIRLSSQTRNGEFKLYRMSAKSLAKFNPDPIKMYKETIIRNYNIISNATYERSSKVELYNENTIEFTKKKSLLGQIDLIITSPPYGDSHTTVAYGQFSRLSNEWLGIKDSGTLDRRLLGGSRCQTRIFDIEELDMAIEQIRENDRAFNRERCWEVVSFYNDYEESLKSIAPTVKSGGYVVYVVGNRRVRNVELPMDVITYKMFEKLGFEHIVTYVRDILNKRMPSKASPANEKGEQITTMMYEYIVVMRKK